MGAGRCPTLLLLAEAPGPAELLSSRMSPSSVGLGGVPFLLGRSSMSIEISSRRWFRSSERMWERLLMSSLCEADATGRRSALRPPRTGSLSSSSAGCQPWIHREPEALPTPSTQTREERVREASHPPNGNFRDCTMSRGDKCGPLRKFQYSVSECPHRLRDLHFSINT